MQIYKEVVPIVMPLATGMGASGFPRATLTVNACLRLSEVAYDGSVKERAMKAEMNAFECIDAVVGK